MNLYKIIWLELTPRCFIKGWQQMTSLIAIPSASKNEDLRGNEHF